MDITQEMKNSVPFKYALDVKNNNIITGPWIKLAVERFFEWLNDTSDSGYYLDHDDAMRYIDFFPKLLNHTKGKLAGKPFELAPFQQFGLYNIFGWKNKKHLRRINKVYDSRAKKNGKTAEMAGIGLEMLCIDGEISSEVYIGATKKEQSKLCFNQAVDFINHSVANRLMSQLGFKVLTNKIIHIETNSIMIPLDRDSKTQDGINSHFGIIDEYHAHPSDSLKQNIESSSIQREQPILYHITTKGEDHGGPCKRYEDVCKDILNGIKKDDHTFIMIHEMDHGDDWENENNWIKSNPLLGQGLDIDKMRVEFISAKNQPSKAPQFKTKNLNMWVDALEVRVPDEIWMANKDKIKIDNFLKYGCAGGMDLSSRIDLSSYVIVSNPDPNGFIDVLPFNFCPKDTVISRSKEDRVPYDYWQNVNLSDYIEFEDKASQEKYKYILKEKILTATPGNQIDYKYIKKIILQTFWLHGLKCIDFDKYKSTELVQALIEQEVVMNVFPQTINYYSYPTQEFERLAFLGKIRHGGHPIMRWCLGRVKAFVNVNEDMRYVKNDPKSRVDPIQATVMAIAGNLTPDENKIPDSQYNNQDEAYI
jgi:phage terminase large subunit-like protein